MASHFPNRVYNKLEDLAEIIMYTGNCHSDKVNMPMKDNNDYASTEPVSFYTDIVKPNLVVDSYVKILTTLHFPSVTGYHWFDHSMYTPIEQSVIEAITIRLVTKNG